MSVPVIAPPPVGARFTDVHAWARTQPLYVMLGCQGSGTNLLIRLLARAFGMSVLRDQSLVFRSAAQLPEHPTPGQVRRAFSHLTRHMHPSRVGRRLRRRLLHRDEHFDGIDDCFREAHVRTARDLVTFVHAYRAFRDGAPLMGVKSDDLWAHLDDVSRVCPQRRVIFLTRDPRDTAMSVMSKAFGPVEPVIAARFVRRRMEAYERAYTTAPGPRLHVRFEALLAAPVDELARMASTFGWSLPSDLEARLADFPFRQGRVGRWERMAPRDVAWCEAELCDLISRYGSAPVSARPRVPGVVDAALAYGRDAVGRVPGKLAFLRALAAGRS